MLQGVDGQNKLDVSSPLPSPFLLLSPLLSSPPPPSLYPLLLSFLLLSKLQELEMDMGGWVSLIRAHDVKYPKNQ